MTHKPQYTKAFTALMAFALVASGCTKKRDAALPDAEALQTFAIEDFAAPTSSGYSTSVTASKANLAGVQNSKATIEKGLVTIDTSSSEIPKRMRFMFEGLEVSGQESQNFRVVFGVDSKFVTAYKLTNDISSLSKLEKQLAVSPSEIQFSIDLQKAPTAAAQKAIVDKIAAAQKNRVMSLANSSSVNVLVPLFKYEIQAKGVLERTKNEMRESTSTLAMRETEFSQATHIKIKTTSDDRKDVGSLDQKKQLEQIFTTDSLDNKVSTAAELQSRYNFNMKFVADDTKVLTKLDSQDMKVFEITSFDKLSQDEQRLVNTNSASGEIIRCTDSVSTDKNCVLRLVAKVPVTYKNVRLTLVDSKANSSSTLDILDVPKAQANGLVEIAREVRAQRARPTGLIDPLNTIKVADLQGEFYFRRTFEDASNMLTVGKTGTSGDIAVVKFELQRDRLVVRNQKALIQYVGQGPKDKEELISVPVQYFKLETVDADGAALQVPRFIKAKNDDADYLEIDWTQNTIPVANSPLAFFEMGPCLVANTSQQVTDMDMRLNKDGILNFSLSGSFTLNYDCANKSGEGAQFNYNIVERLSFRKRSTPALEDVQFAPNLSTANQSAMNFAIFTFSDQLTGPNVRMGRENSQANHPIIHDFRNGKVVNYWVGGLTNSPKERRALIEQAAQEVIAEWNDALHKAFKGTDLDRSGDYLVLNKEDDATRGHLGDLDRNYLWFMDQPAENGLLGVAQFAPNPYSGTIVANNVIVYSGNSETEVRSFMQSYKESREYEKLLEQAKAQAIEEFQKQAEEEAKQQQAAAAATTPATGAAASGGGASAGKASQSQFIAQAKNYNTYLNRIILSARPKVQTRMSSPFTANMARFKVGKVGAQRALRGRTVVADKQVISDKDFAGRVLKEALAGDFKNDPIMLEAIIARELARTEPGLSPEIRAVLAKQAQMKEMSAKFDKAAKKRGGCFMYTRNEYNDRFLETDFDTLFKKEIKATLLHEVGHAIGLRHNFKASFDKENFNFEGEKNNRNYSSIMDYIASPEMEYDGPGTYDVHALRAIYTGLLEVSAPVQQVAAKTNGVITNPSSNVTVNLVNGKYIKLEDVKKLLGFTSWSEMQKQVVDKTGLLKHYYQCHDELIGQEAACTLYDQGSSATEIVKNEIQNYHRMYATSYHASDRINFGWPEKVGVIRRAIEKFGNIRGYLDSYFQMVIFKGALNENELNDFREAAYLGYDFFHEVIRIPDTSLPFGSSADEIAQRLIPVSYTLKTLAVDKDGKPVMDEKGNPKFNEKPAMRILEARGVYDNTDVPMGNRINTLGIGFDKQFAIKFLLTANPAARTDDSQIGWIGFNEFEQYFLGVEDASQSTNMMTLLEIMTGNLKAGFVDENHELHTLKSSITANKYLLDASTLGAIADTNQHHYPGLDTFAEFFKVGTLKGGKSLKDRPIATRYGQSSKSPVAVKFFAPDNAQGAGVLMGMAARKGILLENKDELSKKVLAMLSADVSLSQKAAELVNANPSLKGKSINDLIAVNDDLKKLAATGNLATGELIKALTELNKNGVLVSQEDIATNPNMAIDKQVTMMRGMIMRSMGFFGAFSAQLGSTPLDQLEALFKQAGDVKAANDSLSKLELLALGQEVLVKFSENIKIKVKDQGEIPGDKVMSLLMPSTPLTSAQENLMYVIEDLARFTLQLNPEYIY